MSSKLPSMMPGKKITDLESVINWPGGTHRTTVRLYADVQLSVVVYKGFVVTFKQ